jgi:hypothetical protein
MPRIPYRIVLGLIHRLSGQYNDQIDPPREELDRYLA